MCASNSWIFNCGTYEERNLSKMWLIRERLLMHLSMWNISRNRNDLCVAEALKIYSHVLCEWIVGNDNNSVEHSQKLDVGALEKKNASFRLIYNAKWKITSALPARNYNFLFHQYQRKYPISRPLLDTNSLNTFILKHVINHLYST